MSESTPEPGLLAGTDGCRCGWVTALLEPAASTVSLVVTASLQELVDAHPAIVRWAIDMPVDLPKGPPDDEGVRECDTLARNRLGWPRSSSVFSAPPAAVLAADDYDEACGLAEAASGRKISVQAWNLTPKVREVQALLERSPGLRDPLFETHPELCFARLAGGEAVAASKKTPEGRKERLRLLSKTFGRKTIDRALSTVRRVKGVANDDKIDALAALTAAMRVASGEATRLPPRSDAPAITY